MKPVDRRIYLAFLGKGSLDKQRNIYDYTPVKYSLDGKKSKETKYVQIAELELLGANYFDLIIIVGTRESLRSHYKKLINEATKVLNIKENIFKKIEISNVLNYEDEWVWLNEILAEVNYNDSLVVDLTHGYRSIPIVFSNAINFLIKTKSINLEAVYYGAYEAQKDSKIIDMKDYYIINKWADGVMRLVEVGDSKKLIDLISGNDKTINVEELNDNKLKDAIVKATDSFRNVDINNIYDYTNNLLNRINEITDENNRKKISNILLDLIKSKYIDFAPKNFDDDIYNKDYFKLQLKIIDYLIKHRLYMQSYTVMREFIGSIGMIILRIDNDKKGIKNRMYADIFIRMVSNDEKKWIFSNKKEKNEEKMKDKLLDFYKCLDSKGIINELKVLVDEIKPIRDGLDHAWTSKPKMKEDLENKTINSYKKLEEIIDKIFENV